MTIAEARALESKAHVTWRWQGANDEHTTPGTVVGTDSEGVNIYWADSDGYPTHYAFEDSESWPNIELHTSELVYIPDDEQRITIQWRRKSKP